MNGDRARYTHVELTFYAGIFPPCRRDGWHQPGEFSALAPVYELDAEPSAETAAILRALMNAGQADRLEFLGG